MNLISKEKVLKFMNDHFKEMKEVVVSKWSELHIYVQYSLCFFMTLLLFFMIYKLILYFKKPTYISIEESNDHLLYQHDV